MALTTKVQHEVWAQPWQCGPHILISFRHTVHFLLQLPVTWRFGGRWSISTSVFSKSSFLLNHFLSFRLWVVWFCLFSGRRRRRWWLLWGRRWELRLWRLLHPRLCDNLFCLLWCVNRDPSSQVLMPLQPSHVLWVTRDVEMPRQTGRFSHKTERN